MAKFNVPFEVKVYGSMDVEADSVEEAIEMVESNTLQLYCGNGGYNKLIGTDEENIGLDDASTFEAMTDCIEEEGNPIKLNYYGKRRRPMTN